MVAEREPRTSETVQAEDKCYACQRGLERFFDFPVVQLTGFERVSIPTDLVLPHEIEIYVEPSSIGGNQKVPEDVMALFHDETVTKERMLSGDAWTDFINHEGWQWQRIKYEGDASLYQRARIFEGGGNFITLAIEPFLAKLESLVGQELPTLELEPPEIKIEFPEASPIRRLPEKPLLYTEQPHQDSLRKVDLDVCRYGGRIPGGIVMPIVAKVATLSYEGRLYK